MIEEKKELVFGAGRPWIFASLGVAVGCLVAFGIVIAWPEYLFDPLKQDSVRINTTYIDNTRDDTTFGTTSDEKIFVHGTMESEFRDLTVNSSDFSLEVALHRFLTSLNEDGVKSLFHQANSADFLSHHRKQFVLKQIVNRLAELDPVVALTQIKPLPWLRRKPLFISVIHEWAICNTESLVQHLSDFNTIEQHSAISVLLDYRDELPEATILQLCGDLNLEQLCYDTPDDTQLGINVLENPNVMRELLVNDTKNDLLQIGKLFRVAKELVEQDGLVALEDFIGTEFGYEDRYLIATHLLPHYTKVDPAGALGYANELPENLNSMWDMKRNIRASALYQLTWEDANAATEALLTSEDIADYERNFLWDSIIDAWAGSDPNDFLANIESLPKHVRVRAIPRIATALSKDDPNQAISIAKRVSNPITQKITFGEIVGQWASQNPMQALDWVLSDPDVQDIRSNLIGISLHHLALTEPQIAMDLALSHQQKDSIIGTLPLDQIVINAIARRDIELAIDYLPQISESSKVAVYTDIGLVLIRSHNPIRAVELAISLSVSDKNRFYDMLLSQWAFIDFQKLLDNIDSFPTRNSKSYAAFWLLNHEWREDLTNHDRRDLKEMLSKEHREQLNN